MACCHPGVDSIVGSGHGAVAQETANRGTPCRRGQTGRVRKSAKSPARIGNCIIAPMQHNLGFSAPGRLDPTPWPRPGGRGRCRVRLNEVGTRPALDGPLGTFLLTYLLLAQATSHGRRRLRYYYCIAFVLWAWSLLARPKTETAFARGRKSRLNGYPMDALETGVGTTRAHTHTHTHFLSFPAGGLSC